MHTYYKVRCIALWVCSPDYFMFPCMLYFGKNKDMGRMIKTMKVDIMGSTRLPFSQPSPLSNDVTCV
jgi:hypothetical protein